MRIFLMGGTGLVGSRLIKCLLERKDDVVLLTRRPGVAREKWKDACRVVQGNPMEQGPWMQVADDCDAVVNLVGEGVFNRRWNTEFVQLLRDSRIKSTENVVKALAMKPRNQTGAPKILVNASAIGFYGPHGDEEITEQAPPGNDTMAELCVAWENAAKPAIAAGVRTVCVRVGVVLDKEGGALKQMMLPFKLFMGGPVGFGGRQYVSWIHHEDMVGLLLLALDDAKCNGPMNATAPNPVTNKQFSKALGKALHRPSFMPAPKFMLRLALGQVAAVVTTGQRVLPRVALGLGYKFKFPEVEATMADVVA
ncbi:MAG TPA: TIGR01777 family oxidoreductase [Gemmataceae bacterium]|nr:TIGR01777 family oxidoreductase [Gemmataceae bacterium]